MRILCLAGLFLLIFLTWGLLALLAVAGIPVVATTFAYACYVVGGVALILLFARAVL